MYRGTGDYGVNGLLSYWSLSVYQAYFKGIALTPHSLTRVGGSSIIPSGPAYIYPGYIMTHQQGQRNCIIETTTIHCFVLGATVGGEPDGREADYGTHRMFVLTQCTDLPIWGPDREACLGLGPTQ